MKISRLFNFVLFFAISLFGFECASQASFGQKFQRGITNVLVSPAEIPKYMILETIHAQPDFLGSFYGVFYGTAKGVGFGVSRFLSGFIDTLTFPVNWPHEWKQLVSVEPFSFDETNESVTKS